MLLRSDLSDEESLRLGTEGLNRDTAIIVSSRPPQALSRWVFATN
jgi:hypothetical protein